ncbi:MAG: hypothetical protein ACI39C_07495 [Dietzia sp.]
MSMRWQDATRPDIVYEGMMPGRSDITDGESTTLAEAGRAVYDDQQFQFGEIRDGQLALAGRIDLLNEISGYGCAYMRENRYLTRNTWHLMQFNGLLGPEPKNCVFQDNGFTLAKGTWDIDAQVAHDQHGSGRVVTRLEILYPIGDPRITPENGGVYSPLEAHSEIHPGIKLTVSVSATAVCPEPGYRVRVRTWNEVPDHLPGLYSKLLWLGGTHLTRLSVKRMELDATNAIVETNVPTIGAAEDGE